MSEVYESRAGGVAVLHELATAHEPLTANEVGQRLGTTTGDVSDTLTRLYRTGYVVRRKRDSEGFGPNPYEYAVYQPEGESNE